MARLKRKSNEYKARETLYGRHSPAGYRYLHSPQAKKLKRKPKTKKKEIERTRLSPQTKRQLQGLSETDYAEVMKMLRKR